MDTNYEFTTSDYIDSRFLLPRPDNQENPEKILEAIGFIVQRKKDGSVKYGFCANKFAIYLSKCIRAVQDHQGNLYIYNLKGFYQEAEDWIIGKIVKSLMNQILQLWSLGHELAAMDAYKRDIRKIVMCFNQDDLINLSNGILDIETLELHPHSPDYYCTVQLPMQYGPNEKCPRFEQFICEITGGDMELGKVIQEMVGYCLCHNVKADKAFFLYGNGKNGKSVLAKMIEALVGAENVSNVKLSQLNDNFGLSSLVNKNVNISAENELLGKFDTGNFKAIISGDTVNVTRKYKDDLSTRLNCKMIMLLNTLPSTTDVTYGYFRKILIIPFTQTFDENEDKFLVEKLLRELPGILNWALEGLKRLQANDYLFSSCAAIQSLMEHYQNQQNPTGVFFEESYTQM
ncbi:DNA primase family protein [Marasmitruncus massiliensis]|uniref:DNA primase family protein n=1 Tax=Marasmitruncus massiliensis TaxID=1944642 RepID=UPI000C7E2DC6|nr:phage/plasmid primase, P4 family [Marasmitruncus massiliensis]